MALIPVGRQEDSSLGHSDGLNINKLRVFCPYSFINALQGLLLLL